MSQVSTSETTLPKHDGVMSNVCFSQVKTSSVTNKTGKNLNKSTQYWSKSEFVPMQNRLLRHNENG